MRKQEHRIGAIWSEYQAGQAFKSALGTLGMFDQNRRNERFYAGDQWHGAKTGGERPLVRHNVIKRIGDYKMAVIGSAPLAVDYSVEGVPNTVGMNERVRAFRKEAATADDIGEMLNAIPDEAERLNIVMSALSCYFDTTAERIKFDKLKMRVLRDAYIAGTGYLYVYWDPLIRTGLYADADRRTPIDGDVAVEALDVENVYMGDPNSADIQSQPYILIAQRRSVESLRREAKRNGASDAELDAIRPDNDRQYMAGDRSQDEPDSSKKATVLTRMWRKRHWDGTESICAVRVCNGAVIRKEWDMKIRLYPLASFAWSERKGCAYGDSEITYLIPNQIAINRMITASVWAVMMLGMPITVVNGDVVQEPISNDPGQVIRVIGTSEEVQNAIRYVQPPNFSAELDNVAQALINNTLAQSGANDAALGDIRPDNTSAIVAVREAATLPLQPVQNEFYSFVEDVARIMAEFWAMMYGERLLKIRDEQGLWYMPFNGEDIKDLLISARIDVGAAGLWSEVQAINTLDNLLQAQVITPLQYLERLPKGFVADIQGLIDSMKQPVQPDNDVMTDMDGILSELPPEYREQLSQLPPEQAQQLISKVIGSQM